MNYYVPLFQKILDSSVWVLPDGVVKVWITMLVMQDRDHVVRATPFAIGRRANKSEAEVMEALGILCGPDKERLEHQTHDGRRVKKVEDGWLILNGEFYQKEMMRANRREYCRRKQSEYRKKKSQCPNLPPGFMASDDRSEMERLEEEAQAAMAQQDSPQEVPMDRDIAQPAV